MGTGHSTEDLLDTLNDHLKTSCREKIHPVAYYIHIYIYIHGNEIFDQNENSLKRNKATTMIK